MPSGFGRHFFLWFRLCWFRLRWFLLRWFRLRSTTEAGAKSNEVYTRRKNTFLHYYIAKCNPTMIFI